jgi:glyoxylase-like metal-dependent hydrolase (beta-lactamase superfamily II)
MGVSCEAADAVPDTVPPEVRPFSRSAAEASAEPVVDGVMRLRLPVPYTATAAVNAFLLERDDGWILVDCGSSAPPGWAALEHALDGAGVAPADIRLLVCTHPHADHYGLAAEVMERSGCPLALAPGPTASAEMLRDPIVPLEQRLQLAQRAGVPPSLRAAAVSHPGDDGRHPRPRPDLVLEEGTVIETHVGAWRTVPAPGHSPTQVVLFEEESGMLLSADLAIGGRIPYLEYGYTPDPWADHVGSLERALGLGPRLLLPGHGSPTTDAVEPIAAALGAARAAPGRILAALSDEPLSAFGVAEAVLGPGALFYPRQVALSGALCILERLERLGAAAAEDAPDGVRRYSATGGGGE